MFKTSRASIKPISKLLTVIIVLGVSYCKSDHVFSR